MSIVPFNAFARRRISTRGLPQDGPENRNRPHRPAGSPNDMGGPPELPALVRFGTGSSFEQCVDIGRTHDGPVAHESLVVVLDAVMVVEIVDHDAEGFLDRTACGVAQPIDPFESRTVAE